MKKILLALIILLVGANVGFAKPKIIESLSNAYTYGDDNYIQMDVKAQAVATRSSIVWYARGIGGFAAIAINGFDASSGNATTVTAVPMYADNQLFTTGSVTITTLTDLTDIRSGYYKFTYENDVTLNTTVSFNFMIKGIK